MTTRTISNTDNIIDSRDVLARFNELDELRQQALDAASEARAALNDVPKGEEIPEGVTDAVDALWTPDAGEPEYGEVDEWDEDAHNEHLSLKGLLEDISDPEDGTALINDAYFQEYAEQEAEQLGLIAKDARWPANHIDWEAAADELKGDYSIIEWEGTTFYCR